MLKSTDLSGLLFYFVLFGTVLSYLILFWGCLFWKSLIKLATYIEYVYLIAFFVLDNFVKIFVTVLEVNFDFFSFIFLFLTHWRFPLNFFPFLLLILFIYRAESLKYQQRFIPSALVEVLSRLSKCWVNCRTWQSFPL